MKINSKDINMIFMALMKTIGIGDLAGRTGVSVSAIRFYETAGLLTSERNAAGQRRFVRSDIRRLAFVQIAQQLGFTIEQIRKQLAALPAKRTPNKKDWSKISRNFRKELDDRIERMVRLRDNLDGCIGCGCLSLRACALLNPDDKAGKVGAGPRYLLGDLSECEET
ncbi:redox-sensitive transcriptional activator SoxR [Hoeflea sp. CAU 1731]